MADQARTIRIPVHMVEVINKLARVQRQMLQDLGREPTPEELAKEYNGRALQDLTDPLDPTKVVVPAGQQLDGFAQLTADGKTASGCWIYCGAFTSKGNMMARRDTSDPEDAGLAPKWSWAWPVNRRILYNRASADKNGKPWDPSRKYLAWNGSSWAGGADVPDMRPDAAPEQGVGAFIMNPEGVARLHAVGMNEGPFPEHYEPFENPVGVNLMCPTNPKATSNPAARVYKGDLEAFGKKEEFPYAATTYRLTEHLHYWTKHSRSNAIVQPAPFSKGETAVEPSSSIKVEEEKRPVIDFKGGANLADIVKGLNAIGASPADMVAILEALKQAGAMKAELVVI